MIEGDYPCPRKWEHVSSFIKELDAEGSKISDEEVLETINTVCKSILGVAATPFVAFIKNSISLKMSDIYKSPKLYKTLEESMKFFIYGKYDFRFYKFHKKQ